MSRKADEANRSQLLERVTSYVLLNGVASLSLRPLAKELAVSPAALLYHFRSKEELTVEILKFAGDRQRELFGSMRSRDRDHETPASICREWWRIISAADSRPLFRLFFEVYGLALINPDRFPGFFPGAVYNWINVLEQAYVCDGRDAAEARVCATVVLAGFRGFLLDLCATGDDERVGAAVERWIEMIT